MAERRIVNGWVYEKSDDGQIRPVGPAQPQSQMPTDPSYPYKGDQARLDVAGKGAQVQGQQIDNQYDSATLPARVRKATADAKAAELGAQDAERKLATPSDDQIKSASRFATLDSIVGQINRVQDLYNSDIAPEKLINAFGALDAVGPAAGRFNSAGQGVADQGLNAFRTPGQGSQSDFEARQFAMANTPQAGDWDTAIEEKLANMRRRVDANRQALGLPPAQWTGIPEQDQQIAAAAGIAGGAGAAPGGPGAPPPFSPGSPGFQAATGATRSVDDPATAAEVDRMVRSGASLDAINRFALSKGLMPVNPQEYQAVREYLQKNPGYQGGLVNARKYEPLSLFEQGVTAVGNNPVGAYALGAGQFLSGNTLDNLASDPERARIAMGIQEAQSPTATTLGEISGGIMAGLGGEALLARAGMGSGLARGLLADSATGAANGAGAADSGNRLGSALSGGLASGVGSLGGTMAARGGARMIGATGGAQRPLYEAGVRPTLGQRVADKGVLGRSINATEEALQSVPLVGSAIRGARQEARDQFQIGAFNEALREVGEELPRGMRPGTDPHAYAQRVFDKVYDEARSGMKLMMDEELANDLSSLSPDISTLGRDATDKLDRIIKNHVERRIINGRMEGAAYKATTSDLGKHIARLSKGTTAEEQQLAEVLKGVQASFDNAARRYSDPEAVKLLDAADAGYAKLVRIEGAAARRGGDTGTFSPKQFDAEAQKASGGVRSRSYLRGDALMQDYANAGKTLDDTLPNSGTADRVLAGYAVGAPVTGALGYANPAVAIPTLGAFGAAYAPGARKVMQNALKPAGPKRNAIAERLRKRARLLGTGTGASVGALLLGTSPGQ